MHIGFVSPEMTGHLNPSLALGREIARRGHRVSVFTGPKVRPKVERAGLGFVPIGEAEAAETEAGVARLGELSGLRATLHTIRMLRSAALTLERELPGAIRKSGVEGLVVDQVCPAGAVVADQIRMPYCVACNALACYADPSVPVPTLLWRYRPGGLVKLRNRLATAAILPAFNRLAGVGRGDTSPMMLFLEFERGLAHVAQQPAFFDFPRERLPEQLHYTGPWHEPARDDDVPFPWHRLDGRPLVYASLGTLQNKLRHVYAAIAESVAGLDLQLVIALGSTETSVDLPPRENVIVVSYAPQLRLIDRAAAAITHAGLNTALECLSRGVPMVCLPITNDQPGVARRVEWLGAGEVLPIRRVRSTSLRRLLTKVLETPRYAEAARRCRSEIETANGLVGAADVIETALARGERVPRPAEAFNLPPARPPSGTPREPRPAGARPLA